MAEFKLGRLRFVWQGDWTTGTDYVKDDIVRYGGSSYVCVGAHTAASDFYNNFDAGQWELMTSGLQWRTEPWAATTWYAEGDIVRYGGKIYIAVDGHTASADFNTDFDAGDWQLFVDGVQWKSSPWSNGQLYKEGDLVRHGGKVYICVDGHTSTTDFEADFIVRNKWQLFTDGVQWVNAWTAGTLYKTGDVARVSGKTYICVSEHTASATQRGGFYTDIANWNLYTDGNQYQGAWDTTAYYWVGDIVRYGAKTYVCVLGHEASDLFDTDWDAGDKWELFGDGQQWLSDWVADTRYKEGDVVKHGGRVYICLNGHTSNNTDRTGFDLDLIDNNWEVFSDGIVWKNVWVADTYYKLNDIIRYGAKAYVCVEGHVSAADFYTDVDDSKWDLLVDGQQWKTLPWQISTLYKESDLVRYGGRVYICVNGHTSTSVENRFDTDFDAGEWQLFSDGTQWKTDPWTADTYYKTGDVVRYGGKTYVAIDDHLANASQNGGFYVDLYGDAEALPDPILPKWQLYADGTEWKGNWDVNTYYKLGDVVRYDGNTYVCQIAHTSALTVEDGLELDLDLDPQVSKWSTYAEGFKYKGDWTSVTKYNVNDVVKFGGSLYICIGYHVSVTNLQEEYWNILVGGLEFEDTWSAEVEYQIGDIVTYGGYSYVSKSRNTAKIPPGFASDWELLTTGFKVTGEWSLTRSYKVGEVVNYGGNTYVAVVETGPGQKPTNADGSTSVLWEIVAPGFKWRNTWEETTDYRVGDTVRWIANTYVCIKDHTAIADSANQPDNDTEGEFWNSLAEGAEGNVLSRRGDLVTRDAIQNKRLPRGLPGQVLQVEGRDVKWDYFNIVDNVYYVTTDGIDSPERGTTLQTPFRTIKYACDFIQADLATRAPATIYVKTGQYREELPIRVPAHVAIVGDELRSTRVEPALARGVESVTITTQGTGYSTVPTVEFSLPSVAGGVPAEGIAVLGSGATAGKVVGVTITRAGSGYTSAPIVTFTGGGYSVIATGQAVLKTKTYQTTNMFLLRDATGLRNMTLNGLNVTLGDYNQYFTKRPDTDCCYVSLDPGTGPGDESTWITTRSPYVQNVTTYGNGAVGMKIDGSIHNGGYKTMVCNDYTQVISDGIGIWATNQGRVEAVSVFTYYSHLGYLAEDGGVIRGTNGNCSYGTFGVSAEGVDPSEISRISRVNNRKEEATIINTFTDGDGIVHLEYSNAGQNYEAGNTTYTFDGNGVFGTILVDEVTVTDGGVNEVRVMNSGKDWLSVVNNAQDGNSLTVRVSASDVQITNAYKGERIVIIDGQGVGQYGYIGHFNGGTKVATILKESFTPITITASSSVNNRLTTTSTASLNVNDAIIFDFASTSVIISETVGSTDTIIVDDSTKLAVGMPIEFTGTEFGNIVSGTTYYIHTVVDKTSIKISETNSGVVFDLVDGTGTMSGVAGGMFAGLANDGQIYYVREKIAGGTQFTISTSQGGSELNLITATGLMTLAVAGWESFYNQPIETILDTTSRYTIEPRVVFSTGAGADVDGTISKGVDTISRSSNGGRYQAAPTVLVSGTEADAQGATATATISGTVDYVRIREHGSGFSGTPTVQFIGGGLTAGSLDHAQGTANVTGKITTVAVTNGGSGYHNPPLVNISGAGYNDDAYISARITKVVGEITVQTSGIGYTSVPTVTITGGGGTGAEAVANLDAVVTGFEIQEGGSGYTAITTTIAIVPAAGDTTGDGAEAEIEIDNDTIGGPGVITGVNLVSPGSGYTKAPQVIITSSGLGAGAVVDALISGSVISVTVVKGGTNYTSNPDVIFNPTGAYATASITGSVSSLEIVNGGTGFTSTADLSFVPVSDFAYNEATCSRDVGLLVEAVANDMIFNSNVQSVFAGLAYRRSYSSVVLNTQKAETIAAIGKVRDLVLKETADPTAITRIQGSFATIVNIIDTNTVANTVFSTPDNVDPTTVDASSVLRANKEFLQNEVTAWIDAQIAGGSPPWNSFSYNVDTCKRDIGFIVDSLAYDLLYGGNSLSREIGYSYYEGNTGVLPGQKVQSIAAFDYLKSIVGDIIEETDISGTQISDAISNPQVVTGNPGATTDSTTVENLIDDINDILNDGTFSGTESSPVWGNGDLSVSIRNAIITAIPVIQTDTIAWINAKYVGAGATGVASVSQVVESVTIDYPGTGYTSAPTVSITGGGGTGALGTVVLNGEITNVVVNAPGKNYTTTPTIAFVGGHNFKSVLTGSAYYKNASALKAISNLQITETISAIDYIKDLALAIATNTDPQYEYQSVISRTGTATAPTNAVAQTNYWIDVIKSIAAIGGENTVASNLLASNRAFIAEQSNAHAIATYSAVTVDSDDLKKKVRLVVDALVYDLANGTADRSIVIGQQYAYFFDTYKDESLALLTYINTIAQQILKSSAVDENQSIENQVFAELVTSELTASDAVKSRIGLMKSLVSLDGELGDTGNSTYTDLLLENKTWIQAEVIEYVKNNYIYFDYDQAKCERDVGLILDAVAFDVVLGTNFNSVTAGLAYQRSNAALVKSGQLGKSLDAMYAIKKSILELIEVIGDQTAYTRAETALDTVTNILRYGSNFAPSLAYPAPTGVDQDRIDAKDQLQANRTFLRAEVIAWIEYTYPDLTYNSDKCSRDVGYIVDALSYDILYSGTSATTTAALSYFVGAVSQLGANESAATIAAYQHLQSACAQISRGTLFTPTLGNNETQDTSSGNTSMALATDLGNLLQTIIDVITAGNTSGVPAASTPLVTWASDALQSAKTAIIDDKSSITASAISVINSNINFDYNEALCARDVGYIVDAIASDVRYALSALPVATASTTNVLSAITINNGGEGYGQGTTVTFTGDVGTGTTPAATPIITNGVVTGFTITQPGKGFTVAPTVAVTADTGSGAFARAYVLGALVQQIRIIHPGSGYNAPPYVQLIDPNNTLPGRWEVRIGDGVLGQPTFTSRGQQYLAAATTVESPTGYADTYQVGEFVYIQNLTNIPTPGANLQFEGNSKFYKLVTVRDLQGDPGITGGRGLIIANRAFVQQQVVAFVNNQYPNLEYNEELCFRDVGLIVDAVVADIFGDTERGIEAGKSYYRSVSSLIAISGDQLLPTLAAIDKIEDYLLDIVQNIDIPRNQLFELQVKEPAITLGAAAIPAIQNTMDIVRDIINNGTNIYDVQDLLLDNKAYIQAEVMAFITTTYPDFTYNQDLCRRDVGLIVDAIAYDLFAGLGAHGSLPVSGLSRSREAGLRYYSNASAKIAITEQKAETVAAIQYIADIALAVVNNVDPDVVYQTSVARIPRIVALSVALETRIQDGINEIVNIVNNGLSVLPTGTYSCRIQVSPLFTVDDVPAHNASVTIRSKYSQVRLTNHDFLNVGTGNKSETNYPGIPVNAPDAGNEVLEGGGGRVFYTSTDQDGNFRVGELFAVEQATGIATLNADAFNLSGLNELSLGGINIGGTGATITEFSTDSLFFANSDSIVPTQKAIKTYIASQLGGGGGNLSVNAITAGDTQITGTQISTNAAVLEIIVPDGILITETVASTDTSTGSLVVDGGVGIADDVNVGGTVNVGTDLIVEGNLTVNGTQTTLNVGTLSVEDTNVSIASAATNATEANGAGITVVGPTTPATFTYASFDDSWNANKIVKATSIQNTPVGSSVRSTAAFTTLAADDAVTFTKNAGSTGTNNGTLVVTGGVGVSENLHVGGTLTTVGITVTGSLSLSPVDANIQMNPSGTGGVVISPTGSGGLTVNPTAVGTVDNVNIGNTTRGTGKFTTLESNGKLLVTDATAATSTDTGALQVDGGVGINGALYAGSIQNTPIGSTTRNTGAFTTLDANSTVGFSGTNAAVTISPTGTGGVTISPTGSGGLTINPTTTGTINNVSIGATTRSTAKFTTLDTNGAVTMTGGTTSSNSTSGQLIVTGGVGISENLNVGGAVVITGNLTVNGTTTTVNSTTISVDDKNIELGSVASPTDSGADGGGITLLGTTNKNITWVQSTGFWTFNQPIQASSVQNTPIGSSTANTGAFTSLSANGAVTFTQNTASTTTGTGTLVVTGGLGVSGRINAANFDGIVGANSAAAGTFTTLTATSTVSLSPANASVTASPTGSGTVTINPATAGTINNMSIGASTRGSGAFTTLTANNAVTLTQNATSTTTGTGTLVVTGGVGISENLNVGGAFKAATKSFFIKHPTKPGYNLEHGSLEGPENGVYVRGRLTGSSVIELPDYWRGLVDETTITVQLTAIGSLQHMYVEKIEDNKVYIVGATDCFYNVYGERKDVAKLTVESKE